MEDVDETYRINHNKIFFFYWQKTTVEVETGTDALITLVSHDKPGKSCSQGHLFDFICERCKEGNISVTTTQIC